MSVLDDTPDEEIEIEEIDNQDDINLDDDLDDDDDEEDEGDLVITIGDEEPDPEPADTGLVKDLRKHIRDQAKELKVERAKNTQNIEAKPDIVLGEKPKRPTLESVDHDPDKHEEALDKYETSLTQWHADKKTVADQEAVKKADIDKADSDHQESLKAYNTQKAELKVDDDSFSVAQGNVIDGLSDDQQGLILVGADNPAKVVLGLGTNPAALKKLSAITNPAKFAVAIGKLEMTMKTKRKGPPLPEGKIEGGSVPLSGSGNRALERVMAKAEKTGDRTDVLRIRREQRRAS